MFVPDPFGDPGGRLVRTGLLARYRTDGSLALLGRTDGMAEIDRQLVNLAEIEAELASLPEVQACAVLARPDESGGTMLVGFVAPNDRSSDARAALARSLPAPMVPAVVIPLDQLPTTPDGAVDRAALSESDRSEDQVAPRTPFEREVALIWEELLDVSPVGVYDDFFELGGQSLVAVQLLARLRDEFGVDLTIRELYENFTIADVAWLVLTRMTELTGAARTAS
jgi:aryl carrier-like protein